MTTDPQTERNKNVVRRFIEECLNKGNLDLVDTLFAPELVEQVKSAHPGQGGPFADGVEEILDLVAEGDKVMARWIFRATHTGEFLGIPATGKRVEVTGYSIYYFENGLITWDTMSMEWLDGLEAIGARILPPDGSAKPVPA